MNIAIVKCILTNSKHNKFYNSQDLGLAKSLAKYDYKVTVYNFVKKNNELDNICITDNVYLKYIKVKSLGENSIIDKFFLDNDTDVVVCMSDTQLSVLKLYKMCQKRNILFIPYIGVLKSTNENVFKKYIVDIVSKRNIGLYKKIFCLFKTQKVANQALKYGINKYSIMNVGLDEDLLKTDFGKYNINDLKNELNIPDKKTILFVGRLVKEKRPEVLLEIFDKVNKYGEYNLIIIGDGELSYLISNRKDIIWKFKVPNNEMWKYYCCANYFINLNDHEIFGMAILEAMYYNSTVIASDAPGPREIITNGEDGFITKCDDEIVDIILSNKKICDSNKTIKEKFVWSNTAKVLLKYLNNVGGKNGNC